MDLNAVYVINDFSGPNYEELKRQKATVLGPTALTQLSYKKEMSIQMSEKPIFTLSMLGVGIVLDGYRQKDKEEINN